MSERNYYVICDDNCRFEGMTKEQIYDAIAEATGNTPTPVDEAFITKIKEQNAQASLKMWRGTEAQFNVLLEKDANTVYIIGSNEIRPTQEENIKIISGILVGDNVTISANSYAQVTGDVINVAGYEPVGIAEVNIMNATTGGTGTTKAAINRFTITSQKQPFVIVKNASGDAIKVQVKVSVILKKIA